MRSTYRDHGGTITFNGAFADAASGSGLAQPGGIPFVFVRQSAGIYIVNIDPAILPIAGQATTDGSVSTYAQADSFQAGLFRLVSRNDTGTPTNGNMRFAVTARDGRR